MSNENTTPEFAAEKLAAMKKAEARKSLIRKGLVIAGTAIGAVLLDGVMKKAQEPEILIVEEIVYEDAEPVEDQK